MLAKKVLVLTNVLLSGVSLEITIVKYGWKAVIRNAASQKLAYICSTVFLALINWEVG